MCFIRTLKIAFCVTQNYHLRGLLDDLGVPLWLKLGNGFRFNMAKRPTFTGNSTNFGCHVPIFWANASIVFRNMFRFLVGQLFVSIKIQRKTQKSHKAWFRLTKTILIRFQKAMSLAPCLYQASTATGIVFWSLWHGMWHWMGKSSPETMAFPPSNVIWLGVQP